MLTLRRTYRSLAFLVAVAALVGIAGGCGGSSSTGADDPEDLSGRWLYHQVVTESTFPSTLVGDEGAMYTTVEVAENTITINLADFPLLSGPFDPETGTFTASGSGRGGWDDTMAGRVVNQKKMVGGTEPVNIARILDSTAYDLPDTGVPPPGLQGQVQPRIRQPADDRVRP